jgi:hypothetical protein
MAGAAGMLDAMRSSLIGYEEVSGFGLGITAGEEASLEVLPLFLSNQTIIQSTTHSYQSVPYAPSIPGCTCLCQQAVPNL